MKRINSFIAVLLFSAIVFSSCTPRRQAEPNELPPVPAPQQPPVQQLPKDDETAESTLRFVVMADCRGSNNGINMPIIKKTLESIKMIAPQPSFAVMAGDLVGGASDYAQEKAQIINFKNTVTKYYPIEFFYPGFGNHEATAGEGGERAFKEVFSEFSASFLDGYNKTVYYFDKGDTRFYMLNSNHPGEIHSISDAQLNWINSNTDPSKKHTLYFFHEPAYPTGANIGYSLDVKRLQRNKLWQVVDNSIKPIVFCGHEHNYSRRHIDSSFNENVSGIDFKFNQSIYQITAGTFGAPIYKDYKDKRNVDIPPVTQYHYAVVDITGDTLKTTVYNLDGQVIDSFQQ